MLKHVKEQVVLFHFNNVIFQRNFFKKIYTYVKLIINLNIYFSFRCCPPDCYTVKFSTQIIYWLDKFHWDHILIPSGRKKKNNPQTLYGNCCFFFTPHTIWTVLRSTRCLNFNGSSFSAWFSAGDFMFLSHRLAKVPYNAKAKKTWTSVSMGFPKNWIFNRPGPQVR